MLTSIKDILTQDVLKSSYAHQFNQTAVRVKGVHSQFIPQMSEVFSDLSHV